MRIGLVCPYNYFRPGGVQNCIRDLADELEKRGHYVRIIAPKPKEVPEKIESRLILLGGSTELNTPFATKADVGVSGSAEKAEALLAAEQFDVLHIHEPGVPVFGLQLLAKSNAANVATLHACMPDGVVARSYQRLMSPIARSIQSKVHVITAVSTVAEDTARTYIPAADITIVPNGIRLGDFPPAPRKKSGTKKTMLYIGRLEKRKGVRYLLKAYADFRQTHDNVELILVGDGDLRTSLESYVVKNQIPDVIFKGFVSDVERLRLLRSADLYCSPALYGESFGIVLLEAMATKTVTVAGNNLGYTSVMQDRGRLSLVNPKSTIDFSQRLELLLYDQPIRELWLEWASDYVQQFDYTNIADQYEAVYKRAIKAKKAAA